MVYNLIQLVNLVFQLLQWLIIARILVSWVPIDPRHPVIRFIESVTEPLLAPLRRLIPPIGGPGMRLDVSPLVAVLLLQLVWRLVNNYLITTLY